MWRDKKKKKKKKRFERALVKVSHRGIGVASPTAVTDGGLLHPHCTQHVWLYHTHYSAASVLHSPHLQHLNHLCLRFLLLGQRLPCLLHLLVQLTVHLAYFVWYMEETLQVSMMV